MALSTGRMKLYDALKTLRVHWDRVREAWDDPVALDFEETYWKPLGAQVDVTLRETDRLGQVLAKLRRDCS
jgi:hypothetical protein